MQDIGIPNKEASWLRKPVTLYRGTMLEYKKVKNCLCTRRALEKMRSILKKEGVTTRYQRYLLGDNDLMVDYGSYSDFFIIKRKNRKE